jgi:hypothetical protein
MMPPPPTSFPCSCHLPLPVFSGPSPILPSRVACCCRLVPSCGVRNAFSRARASAPAHLSGPRLTSRGAGAKGGGAEHGLAVILWLAHPTHPQVRLPLPRGKVLASSHARRAVALPSVAPRRAMARANSKRSFPTGRIHRRERKPSPFHAARDAIAMMCREHTHG